MPQTRRAREVAAQSARRIDDRPVPARAAATPDDPAGRPPAPPRDECAANRIPASLRRSVLRPAAVMRVPRAPAANRDGVLEIRRTARTLPPAPMRQVLRARCTEPGSGRRAGARVLAR